MEWVESRKSHNLSRMDRTGASQVVLVVKNPPANAGDPSSIPGRGRGRVLWCSGVRVSRLPSPSSRACVLQLLSPRAQSWAPHQEKQLGEKPLRCSGEQPRSLQLEKPRQRLRPRTGQINTLKCIYRGREWSEMVNSHSR